MTIRGAPRSLQAPIRSTLSHVLACNYLLRKIVPELNYRREIELATKLARLAGAVLLQHYYSPFLVEQKVNTLQEIEEVTTADREANELIVNRLREAFPDDGILAEESTDSEHRLS